MVMPNSLKIRGILFAFLFGPPRFVSRDDAAGVHGKVCDALGYDDFVFKYSPSEESIPPGSRGFSMILERKEGRGVYAVSIENSDIHQPIRLLLTHSWPQSREVAKERFDLTNKAVFDGLGGQWQRVLAEVRIRGQCALKEGNGLVFLTQELMRISPQWVESLGKPLLFGSVKFEVESSRTAGNSLSNPRRELDIEVLREEPGGLYVELVSQWSQFPRINEPVLTLDPATARPIDRAPSEYVEEAYRYLEERIKGLRYKEDASS